MIENGVEISTFKIESRIFEEFDPLLDNPFRIMDNSGKIILKKWMTKEDDQVWLKAYKDMLFARTADLMTISFQRQGRIYTYPPNYGQEAISQAAGMVMREEDWLVPAFRELGAYLAKGVTLKELFIYFMGNEEGNAFKKAKNVLPISVPIASQLTHAAGIGYAINYQDKDDVVFAFVGDGGTSEGDFHEALNFASVWKAPVVFIVQNNQFAISVPFKLQTNSVNIAVKSVAYGMQGIKVDGNDIFAMYQAVNNAAEYARSKKGPVLIEALTFRRGAHTTSDDPTKYRTKEEEEQWAKTDPLARLKAYIMAKKIWTEEEETELLSEYKKEINLQFEEAENQPPYRLDDVFDHLYSDMPEDLKKQKADFQLFLTWKESLS